MKHTLPAFILFIIAGCNSDNRSRPNIVNSSIPVQVSTNDQSTIISSFDFIHKLYAENIKRDNFYPKDQTGYKIKISNLIVMGYSINSDYEAYLNCIAFSPENKKYISCSSFRELAFQIGNEIISNNERGLSTCYRFSIKLANPKDIKTLPFYDASKSDKKINLTFINNNDNDRDLSTNSSVTYYVENIVNITGIYKGWDELGNNLEFENCTFEIVKSFQTPIKETKYMVMTKCDSSINSSKDSSNIANPSEDN